MLFSLGQVVVHRSLVEPLLFVGGVMCGDYYTLQNPEEGGRGRTEGVVQQDSILSPGNSPTK